MFNFFQEGFLDLEKCVEFDVPPGPQLQHLRLGNDITLDNGQIVKHSDVTSPSKPKRNIISEFNFFIVFPFSFLNLILQIYLLEISFS